MVHKVMPWLDGASTVIWYAKIWLVRHELYGKAWYCMVYYGLVWFGGGPFGTPTLTLDRASRGHCTAPAPPPPPFPHDRYLSTVFRMTSHDINTVRNLSQ